MYVKDVVTACSFVANTQHNFLSIIHMHRLLEARFRWARLLAFLDDSFTKSTIFQFIGFAHQNIFTVFV